MENTAMQKILEAEKQADKLVAEGVKKARSILEKSAKDIKDLTIGFEENLEKEISEILKTHTDGAMEESKELELSYAKESEEIKKKASANVSKAVDFVIEKMGDSKWQ